jgi:PEP-CTERM motif
VAKLFHWVPLTVGHSQWKTFYQFMKLHISFLGLFVATALSLSNASADMFIGTALLSWDTSGQDGTETSLAATVNDPNVSTGGTLNVLTEQAGVKGAPTPLPTTAPGTLYSVGWSRSDDFNQSTNYLSFSVAAAAGFELTLDSLDFAISGTATAPKTGRWGYSLDGGQTFVFGTDFLLDSSKTPGTETWTFDSPVVVTNSIEFRFWSYGATSVNGGTTSGLGGVRLGNGSDSPDLVLNGSSSAIPEPSTYVLFGLAAAGLLVIHNRSKRFKTRQ